MGGKAGFLHLIVQCPEPGQKRSSGQMMWMSAQAAPQNTQFVLINNLEVILLDSTDVLCRFHGLVFYISW
jgi:hypothetical protein